MVSRTRAIPVCVYLAAVVAFVSGCSKPPQPTQSLLDAAKAGNVEEVRSNLYWGCEIEATDASRRTALHLAAWDGQEKIAQMLIAKGADIGVKNKDGFTPLHFAASQGHAAIVSSLLSKGADVNVVAEFPQETVLPKGGIEKLDGADPNALVQLELGTILVNWTPLSLAAGNGHKEVVEILLKHGANVEARNGFGETPLHRAASQGHKEIVQTLLAHGADVNAKSKMGETPLRQALSKGHAEIAELLQKGAR